MIEFDSVKKSFTLYLQGGLILPVSDAARPRVRAGELCRAAGCLGHG
jgi:alpha-D-ribose 1-methylphosphonate 5-triphosphate synthase subunit PhnL